MSDGDGVEGYYRSGALLQRLEDALRDDGVDPSRPTLADLAPYDQFHGRGQEATEQIAGQLPVAAGDRVLDVGSGFGGPARYVAHRFGCHVTGIDLTAEFCALARDLNARLGLQDRVDIHEGSALDLPFADGAFDGAYSMNVSMNIADRAGLYGELFRVLKPGAWLLLSEIARGESGTVLYPTPWAASEETSFLSTPAETRSDLEAAGFEVVRLESALEATLDYGNRSREAVERGEKPPQRAVQLVHGAGARKVAANTTRNMVSGAILPIELFARRPR